MSTTLFAYDKTIFSTCAQIAASKPIGLSVKANPKKREE